MNLRHPSQLLCNLAHSEHSALICGMKVVVIFKTISRCSVVFFIFSLFSFLSLSSSKSQLKSWGLETTHFATLLFKISYKIRNLPQLLALSDGIYSWRMANVLRYCKVASSNTFRLAAHAGFFKLLMKGIFNPDVLWPFDKKLNS